MATGFEFDFRSRSPVGVLGRFVESIWYARGTVPYRRERIAPTGSTVAVVVLGDPILETADDGRGPTLRADRGFLIGPHDRPVVNEPTGETHAVGIVTTAIGAGPVFGVRPAHLRGRIVDLAPAWPVAEALRTRLLALDDADAKLDAVDAAVGEHLAAERPGLDRCEAAVALLEADPTRPIADVAAEVGVSHAHLDREFSAVVGMSPRALARLLRMRRLLAGLDVAGDVGWAALAADLGWYDQAHLIRDFKRHTGVTPTEYLAAQRTFQPSDVTETAGFVPEA